MLDVIVEGTDAPLVWEDFIALLEIARGIAFGWVGRTMEDRAIGDVFWKEIGELIGQLAVVFFIGGQGLADGLEMLSAGVHRGVFRGRSGGRWNGGFGCG